MYLAKELEIFPFFKKILENNDINNITDSLTGVINRNYFIEFIKTLIEEKKQFVFGLLDLDNFKSINDNYGHQIGDEVLINISESLRKAILNEGLVGRFGGDEFLFVHFGDISYEAVHHLFERLYNGSVIRKNIKIGDISPFITATCGSCSYPVDADNYDDLFKMADKTLYRGKSKGRNCFIIYVEEKHKNIDVTKLISTDLYTLMHNLYDKFNCDQCLLEKLRNCSIYLMNSKKISHIYYVDKENNMIDIENKKNVGKIDLEKLLKNKHYFKTNNIEEIVDDVDVYNKFAELKALSILIMKIKKKKNVYGYMIFTDVMVNRLWQIEDESLLFFFSTLMSEYLFNNK